MKWSSTYLFFFLLKLLHPLLSTQIATKFTQFQKNKCFLILTLKMAIKVALWEIKGNQTKSWTWQYLKRCRERQYPNSNKSKQFTLRARACRNQLSSQVKTNQSQDSLARMGPKSWRTLQDDNITISNILFIESIVANNFLEKNFEETAEKYF